MSDRTQTTLIPFPKKRIKRYRADDGSIWEIMPDGWHQLIRRAQNGNT